MYHVIYICFVFVLGACIGSFLNVVVWRLPRGESLSTPPSHCPMCDRRLWFRDNIPILGWFKLGGRCRFCKSPISKRYPIVETLTALLFVFYYVMFFMADVGPCPPLREAMFAEAMNKVYGFIPLEWPMFLAYLFVISALLAASLIDAELYFIPAQIPISIAIVGLLFHTLLDTPRLAGSLSLVPSGAGEPHAAAALAAGGAAGLALSLLLWKLGLLPKSFPDGEPPLAADSEALAEEEIPLDAEAEGQPPSYTSWQIRLEVCKELLFLLPPMAFASLWFILTTRVPGIRAMWVSATAHDWVGGLLGSIFGGLIGGFTLWITRILGTLGFGRLAMGLGDVDLMVGVGTVVGAGAVTVAFFSAPIFALAITLYMIVMRVKKEVPFGPYLSLGTGFVMLFYCPIEQWLAPGFQGLILLLTGRAAG